MFPPQSHFGASLSYSGVLRNVEVHLRDHLSGEDYMLDGMPSAGHKELVQSVPGELE